MKVPEQLISLAHVLGNPENDLCILSEGNVSCDCGDGTFWIKASGCCLKDAVAEDFVRVESSQVLSAINGDMLTREEERSILNRACIERAGDRIPSTEAFFHAALLWDDNAKFIAHSHPAAVIAISMTEFGEAFCDARFFPDQVVFTGRASCWVPYTDPGIQLARAITQFKRAFIGTRNETPVAYLLQNHGLVTTGNTAKATEAATLMSVKAANAMLMALSAGAETFHFLEENDIAAILNWPDEHYRRARLTNPENM